MASDACNQKDIFDGSNKWTADRRLLIREIFKYSLSCENICDRLEVVNDITLWLLIQATMLATWTCGDDSYRACRVMGNLSSAVYALGFHKGVNQDKKTPRFMVELRLRAMALTHMLDKGLAAFTGRPPRLSRHYCVTEMMTDVSDKVLLGPPSGLEEAERRLGSDGWDPDEIDHPASTLRACMIVNELRERILELSLSTKTDNLESEVQ